MRMPATDNRAPGQGHGEQGWGEASADRMSRAADPTPGPHRRSNMTLLQKLSAIAAALVQIADLTDQVQAKLTALSTFLDQV